MLSSRPVRLCVLVCLAAVTPLSAQNAQPLAPNSDPSYQQLRNITLSGEAVTVNNLVLKRDAATFHLRSGTVCFVAAVQGKVTGAVFVGEGNMVLDPPEPGENETLKLLTKEDLRPALADSWVFQLAPFAIFVPTFIIAASQRRDRHIGQHHNNFGTRSPDQHDDVRCR